jgi:hypothetical protein
MALMYIYVFPNDSVRHIDRHIDVMLAAKPYGNEIKLSSHWYTAEVNKSV